MENLTINQGIKFLVSDGKGVIGTADPSGSQGISKTAGHTGFYIQSSVDYTLWFYDGSAWASHQSIDVSDANYTGGFAFAWEDNTAAYIKTADASHEVFVFGRNTDLKVDSTPGDSTQAADSIVDGTGSLSITSINAQNYYTEALSVDNSGTVTFDRTDDNAAYQLKFEGTNITIGNNGSDTITLTGGDEFTSPLTTDGDLFIQDGSSDSRLGIGSDGQYLSVSSGSPAWVDLSASPWSTYTSPDDYVEFTLGGVSIGGGNTYTTGGVPYRDGVLVVGKTNTLNKIQRGLIVGYDNRMGVNDYSSSSSVFGMSNRMLDGIANMASGGNNYIGYGNYNHAFGYGNKLYGDRNIGLGHNNWAGTTTANVDDTVTIGYGNRAYANNQIVIGRAAQTNASYMSEEGIYIGIGNRPNAGFFNDPGAAVTNPINFAIGSNSAMRSDSLGMVRSGAGSGMFYMHNEPADTRLIEPTTDLSNGIAMWAKNRSGSGYGSSNLGLLVKGELGGMSWIGDRIGVNVTSDGTAINALSSTIDAGLHVFGEGSTSATSSFKVENSGGSTLFEVKDDGTVEANGGSLLKAHSSGVVDFNTANQNTFAGSMYNGTVVNIGYINNIAAGARSSLFVGYGHDIDKYVDKAVILGQLNKVHASTDSSHASYASLGLKGGGAIIGSGNYGNGDGIQVIGASNQVWGSNNSYTMSMALGNTILIGKTSSHAEDSFAFGKSLTMNGDDVRNIMMFGYSFSANNAIHDENTPMLLFGAQTGRPTIAMMADPDEQTRPMNLILGSTHVAYSQGTNYPLQGGSGNGCIILHGSENATTAPSATIPDVVTMYAGDRSYDGNNAVVGGKGLIIKGENSGRTYISERVGINVSHNSAKTSQINEDVEAGLHIYGEGNSDATSSVKVENSDGNVAIEVLNDLVVVMPNLPTSSAGLPTGALYNDGGTVKVA